MLETDFKIEYEKTETVTDRGIPVIIAAAGSSSRMQGIQKQFTPLSGIPVLARTLLNFERSQAVSKIIIAARDEDIPAIQLLAQKYMIHKLSDIVPGGANRQQSVANCLERLTPGDKKVLIHDGARPLAGGAVIRRVTDALEDHQAVACGIRLKDTVKRVGADGFVLETLDRESLFAVQTPQGAWVDEYRQAVSAAGNFENFTDDMSLMEAAGYPVFTVAGSVYNIKITTPEDIVLAQSILTEIEV